MKLPILRLRRFLDRGHHLVHVDGRRGACAHAHPTWFLLVAGHEDQDEALERIVDAEQGYVVVEKTGAAGEEAARLHRRLTNGG